MKITEDIALSPNNSEKNVNENTIDEQLENLENIDIPNSLAMIPIKECNLIYAKKGIRWSYRINKRIKLILYKLFRKLPSFITGNYRRRINL